MDQWSERFAASNNQLLLICVRSYTYFDIFDCVLYKHIYRLKTIRISGCVDKNAVFSNNGPSACQCRSYCRTMLPYFFWPFLLQSLQQLEHLLCVVPLLSPYEMKQESRNERFDDTNIATFDSSPQSNE